MLTKEQIEYIKEKYEEKVNEYGLHSSTVFGYESALVMILDMLGEEIDGIND